MIDDASDMAYENGKREGQRKGKLVRDVVIFALAAFFAFATELGTYRAGVAHGVATAVASDYLKNVYTMGYARGLEAGGR